MSPNYKRFKSSGRMDYYPIQCGFGDDAGTGKCIRCNSIFATASMIWGWKHDAKKGILYLKWSLISMPPQMYKRANHPIFLTSKAFWFGAHPERPLSFTLCKRFPSHSELPLTKNILWRTNLPEAPLNRIVEAVLWIWIHFHKSLYGTLILNAYSVISKHSFASSQGPFISNLYSCIFISQ